MIPRLLGFMGFNSHPSLIIELNRKCLNEKVDPIFKEHLFSTLSFSVQDLDALLGNSAKVVMERVKRFPMTASFKKTKSLRPLIILTFTFAANLHLR